MSSFIPPQLIKGGPQSTGWGPFVSWLQRAYQGVEGIPATASAFYSRFPGLFGQQGVSGPWQQAVQGEGQSIPELIKAGLPEGGPLDTGTAAPGIEPAFGGMDIPRTSQEKVIVEELVSQLGGIATSPSVAATMGTLGGVRALGEAGKIAPALAKAVGRGAGTAFTGAAAGQAVVSGTQLAATLSKEGFSDEAARLVADTFIHGGFAALMGRGVFKELKASEAALLRRRMQTLPEEEWALGKPFPDIEGVAPPQRPPGVLTARPPVKVQGEPTPGHTLPGQMGSALLDTIRADPRVISMGGGGPGKGGRGPGGGPEWMQSEGRTGEHGGRKTPFGRRPKGAQRAPGERAFQRAVGESQGNVILESQAIMGQNSVTLTKAINHAWRQSRLPVGEQQWPTVETSPSFSGRLPSNRVIRGTLAKKIHDQLAGLGLLEAFSRLTRRQRTPEALSRLIGSAQAGSGPISGSVVPPPGQIPGQIPPAAGLAPGPKVVPGAAPIEAAAEVVGASARARAPGGRGPLTGEQIDTRAETRLQAAENEIATLERMGETGDFTRLQALRKEAADLRTSLKVPEQAQGISSERALAKAEGMIRNAENQVAVQRELSARPELVTRLREARKEAARLRSMQERGEIDEGWYMATADLVRTIRANFDVSGYRQMAPAIPGSPISTLRSSGRALQGMVSGKQQEVVYGRMDRRMIDTPQGKVSAAELGESAGLFRSRGANMVEEEMRGAARLDKLLKGMKLHPVAYLARASQRHFETLLDSMRLEKFTTLSKRLYKKGFTPEEHPAAFKEAAQYANLVSGRGDPVDAVNVVLTRVGKREGLSPSRARDIRRTLAFALWSPKLVAARWQHMGRLFTRAPQSLRKEGLTDAKRILRREMNKDAVAGAATGLAIMEAARRAGAEISLDPDEADFGKIKVGNTRYDIWGGYVQNLRTIYRSFNDGIENVRRYSREVSGKPAPSGKTDRANVVRHWQTYFRYKASPAAGYLYSLISGEDPFGRPFHAWDEFVQQFTPLSTESLREVWNDPALQNLTDEERLLLGLPDIIGISTSTYAPREDDRFSFSRGRSRRR